MKIPVRMVLATVVLTLACSLATAQPQPLPITFQFTFCGDDSPAQARGFITFDENLLINPFSGSLSIPGPEILDLSVTVSGASAGNGVFALDEFTQVSFDSNGGTLDLGSELVGQPTDGLPWGTEISGNSGEFNLFSVPGHAPSGVWYFYLGADRGDKEAMRLKSMSPGTAENGSASCDFGTSTPIPTINFWGKIALFLLLTSLTGLALRQRNEWS